jgi:hypothetical protein
MGNHLHHNHGLPVPAPEWQSKFNTAPAWPYSGLPPIGYFMGDWKSHVVLTEDAGGVWAFTICRSCGKPWFEYVPREANGWPAEARCGEHRQ